MNQPHYEKDERITKQFNLEYLILGQNLSFWKGGSSRSEIILGAPFFKKVQRFLSCKHNERLVQDKNQLKDTSIRGR